MPVQSTRHLFLIEPSVFYLNPETADTNHYQVDKHESHEETLHRGIKEFRDWRDTLIENGVIITTALGSPNCPDHVFPNWISTHENRQMVIYPMLNPNRRAEKTPEIVETLKKMYDVVLDLSAFEAKGQALESTGSLCLDRVNKIVYAGLSKRTSAELVQRWADAMGYKAVTFETRSHTGQPVYHSDLVMFIGTDAAGICAPCVLDKDRDRVLGSLRETHDVIEFTGDQLQSFCGNSLEILGKDDKRMLAMSKVASLSLSEAQEEHLARHFSPFVLADIPTLELYGGGSARCTIMEMF
jgi:hypothetical protein